MVELNPLKNMPLGQLPLVTAKMHLTIKIILIKSHNTLKGMEKKWSTTRMKDTGSLTNNTIIMRRLNIKGKLMGLAEDAMHTT